VLAGSRPDEIKAAQAVADQAAAAQGQAEAQLQQLRNGLRPEEIAQAQATYERQRQIVAAKARLAICRRGRPQEVQAAQAVVNKAQTAVEKTRRTTPAPGGLWPRARSLPSNSTLTRLPLMPRRPT